MSRLAIIGVGAFLVRILYIALIAQNTNAPGDFLFYNWTADLLAEGRGFLHPLLARDLGREEPTALHPPAWPFVLSLMSRLTGPSDDLGRHLGHRIVGAALGSYLVVLLGVLGRRVGGTRVAILAALVAACSPGFIAFDASTMSETLYGVALVATLLAAYALLDAPSLWRACLLGVLVGACALTRAEGLLLAAFVACPVGWISGRDWSRRLAYGLAVGLGMALVLVPWTVRNAVAFGHPVLIATSEGALWRGANCDAAYSGTDIGTWQFSCLTAHPGNEAELSRVWRREGIAYAIEHRRRLPFVMIVRVLRTWNLYGPMGSIESQPRAVSVLSGVAGWLLAVAGAVGGVRLHRRGQPLVVLCGPILLVTVVAMLGQGTPRFRYGADVALVPLAAVAIEALLDRREQLPPGHQHVTGS